MELDAIIEVPQNSKVKYEFCNHTNRIRVDRILPSAYNYPFNYGYIDYTLAEDGDKLDIVVLNNQPIYPMSIIKVKPIGVLLMRDGKDMDHLENDPKILALPADSVKLSVDVYTAMVVLRMASGYPILKVAATKLIVPASTVMLDITTQYCAPAA